MDPNSAPLSSEEIRTCLRILENFRNPPSHHRHHGPPASSPSCPPAQPRHSSNPAAPRPRSSPSPGPRKPPKCPSSSSDVELPDYLDIRPRSSTVVPPAQRSTVAGVPLPRATPSPHAREHDDLPQANSSSFEAGHGDPAEQIRPTKRARKPSTQKLSQKSPHLDAPQPAPILVDAEQVSGLLPQRNGDDEAFAQGGVIDVEDDTGTHREADGDEGNGQEKKRIRPKGHRGKIESLAMEIPGYTFLSVKEISHSDLKRTQFGFPAKARAAMKEKLGTEMVPGALYAYTDDGGGWYRATFKAWKNAEAMQDNSLRAFFSKNAMKPEDMVFIYTRPYNRATDHESHRQIDEGKVPLLTFYFKKHKPEAP